MRTRGADAVVDYVREKKCDEYGSFEHLLILFSFCLLQSSATRLHGPSSPHWHTVTGPRRESRQYSTTTNTMEHWRKQNENKRSRCSGQLCEGKDWKEVSVVSMSRLSICSSCSHSPFSSLQLQDFMVLLRLADIQWRVLGEKEQHTTGYKGLRQISWKTGESWMRKRRTNAQTIHCTILTTLLSSFFSYAINHCKKILASSYHFMTKMIEQVLAFTWQCNPEWGSRGSICAVEYSLLSNNVWQKSVLKSLNKNQCKKTKRNIS